MAGLFHLLLSFDRFLSYASLCRHEGLAVVTFNAIFPRMRTRALQPKRRKLVTPSTPATDYQAVAAADGSTSGSTNAHTGTDTGTVKTSRPLVKTSRPLVKISRPLVKKYRREIFTRGRDVVRPLVCPLVLPPYKNSILKISEISVRCKRCHQFVFYTSAQRNRPHCALERVVISQTFSYHLR